MNIKGSYRTFDHSELTAQNGGKARAIEKIKVDNPLYENIVMIGDGITDLEACPPAKYFIGMLVCYHYDLLSLTIDVLQSGIVQKCKKLFEVFVLK